MPLNVISRLLLLFAGHALCDYPLQGDFLAKGKNHKAPIPGIPWYHCLIAHGLIHAGMVCLVTGSLWFGLAEFAIHCATDYAKCNGNIDFQEDQFVHYSCKMLWALL